MQIKLSATLKDGIGKKSGKPYTMVEILFPNGYKKVIFPQSNEEQFIFDSILKKGDSQ